MSNKESIFLASMKGDLERVKYFIGIEGININSKTFVIKPNKFSLFLISYFI